MQSKHNLLDWLDLHGLDEEFCRLMAREIDRDPVKRPDAHPKMSQACKAIPEEIAWVQTIKAMHAFFPGKQRFIDDTFENSAKILLDRQAGARRAVTLDNGPTAYPTILLTYRGSLSDALTMAHEFGHALQIRASAGTFVTPIMRELCAFLGEAALLSYNRQHSAAFFGVLLEAWRNANRNYLETSKKALLSALARPTTLYSYSWNYPIARHLATLIPKQCSEDWIWRLFEGTVSVREAAGELGVGSDQN